MEEARERPKMIGALTGPGPEMAAEEDLLLGTREVPARVYSPTPEPGPGLIVYFHGGGWALGEVGDFDGVCRRLAQASGCEVLSVGYRLAPEHPYPAGLEDALEACEQATRLAAGRPLVLAGDSAGGNLAAVLARRNRDAAEAAADVRLQLLVYPVVDHDFKRPSYLDYGNRGYPLGAREMEWFWDLYIADEGRREDADATPLRGELSGLPPAFLVIAEHDPLRDEGLAYAEALERAGVPVEVAHFEDVTHGFFTMAGFLDRGDEAIAVAAAAIRRALDLN
jgi:acetyl esterase